MFRSRQKLLSLMRCSRETVRCVCVLTVTVKERRRKIKMIVKRSFSPFECFILLQPFQRIGQVTFTALWFTPIHHGPTLYRKNSGNWCMRLSRHCTSAHGCSEKLHQWNQNLIKGKFYKWIKSQSCLIWQQPWTQNTSSLCDVKIRPQWLATHTHTRTHTHTHTQTHTHMHTHTHTHRALHFACFATYYAAKIHEAQRQ